MLSVSLPSFRTNEWLNLSSSCRLCPYNYGMLTTHSRTLDPVSDTKNSDPPHDSVLQPKKVVTFHIDLS